ncbi:MAG: class I SAM-dependent methyltransferase [Chloroflexota bacterium]|nr:MAG: class I SAM-dependent methyltransferase [Chloroflexota bacterium]
MFEELERINMRPKPFEFDTTRELWTDEYISKQMLSFHLDGETDIASRNTKFIDKSVEWISSYFRVGAGMQIADFGCGPGLYTTRLGRKQAEVTGIDFSARSIESAQQIAVAENLPVEYINQDYLEYETGETFDLITMIFCDFAVLEPSKRAKMLSKFHAFLKAGGSILFDIPSLKAFDKREETTIYEVNLMNSFWSPEKYHGFLQTLRYTKEKVILDKYTIIEAKQTRVFYNWLQHYSREMIADELGARGFRVRDFFSDVAGSVYDQESEVIAIVAGKA